MMILRKVIQTAGYRLVSLANAMGSEPVYSENSPVTWCVGSTCVFDILNYRPEVITRVFYRKDTMPETLHEEVLELARQRGIETVLSSGPVPKQYGWSYSVSAEVAKWDDRLEKGCHVVLVDPALISNIGAIIRSALAFGIHNVAVIADELDSFSPRLLRSSMSARAVVHVERFDSIGSYLESFPENNRYAFMLDAAKALGDVSKKEPYSLIFGNESRGLPPEYADFCQPVFVEQTEEVDSLNIAAAAVIGLYSFQRLK